MKEGQVISSNFSLKYKDEAGQVRNRVYYYRAMLDDSMLVDKFTKVIEQSKIVKKTEAIFPKNGEIKYTNQIIQLTFEYNLKANTGDMSENPLNNRRKLRAYVYNNGLDIDGIHYVRWMRSAGSARAGKVLFINEKLLHTMDIFSNAGVRVDGETALDIASFEAYRSLMLSNKIGDIEIKPENILLVDDYESVFEERCNVTSQYCKKLCTKVKTVKVKNSIWDGQSLIDPSIMGEYSDKGMVLLRNVMFKSCCFNCNIQKWFADNGITEVSQLNGTTIATDIKDIRMITTPSSIKYKKFADKDWYIAWLKEVGKTKNRYGVVKYEKPQKHEHGLMTRTHYQLLNTLELGEEALEKLMSVTVDRINEIVGNPHKMLEFCSDYVSEEDETMYTHREVVYRLLLLNMRLAETHFYSKLVDKIKNELRNDIKRGKLFISGNYSVLCGNPVEMLQQSIGTFDGKSIVGIGNIMSIRFPEQKLLVCRSPHITMGNIYLPENVHNEEISKYMNLTPEILILNSIEENTLQRLQGCDFDSDTILITDEKILIDAAQSYYKKFKVPYNDVDLETKKEKYSVVRLADLDYKTGNNLIGEIVNLSQLLNSVYWHRKANKAPAGELRDIYNDVCKLSVMSGLEIDKAKKELGNLDIKAELKNLKDKYSEWKRPHFMEFVQKRKKSSPRIKTAKQGRRETKKHYKYNTSMDMLYSMIRYKNLEVSRADGKLSEMLSGYTDKRRINISQRDEIITACQKRLKKNYLIPTFKIREDKHNYKRMADEDLKKAFRSICKKNIGINTIRSCLEELQKEEQGNTLIEYMLLALLECKPSLVEQLVRKIAS